MKRCAKAGHFGEENSQKETTINQKEKEGVLTRIKTIEKTRKRKKLIKIII
jgi:hypothetical protein